MFLTSVVEYLRKYGSKQEQPSLSRNLMVLIKKECNDFPDNGFRSLSSYLALANNQVVGKSINEKINHSFSQSIQPSINEEVMQQVNQFDRAM